MQKRIFAFLAIETIWLAICVFIFGYFLDFFGSTYFRFGPSDDLVIVGLSIRVNTWDRYILLMLYQFIDPVIGVASGDFVFPWVYSSVMNPDKKEIDVPKFQAWSIANYTWLLKSAKRLFSLGVSMSQIDFFLMDELGALVTGAITSFICVKEKIYVAPYDVVDQDIDLEEVV